jgi:AcrR family transcriptional regulator
MSRPRGVDGGRRAARHARKRAAILAGAWKLAEDVGVAGISLRKLAALVDLTQPALYTYFTSKDDLYDAMFREGFDLLLADLDAFDEPDAQPEADHAAVVRIIEWCRAHPRHFELMFQRPVPGFVPTAASYGLSLELDRRVEEWLARLGITDGQLVDLLGSVPLGLVSLQLANEPDGDRWTKLVPRAMQLLLDGIDAERMRKTRERSPRKKSLRARDQSLQGRRRSTQ